jgi:hypothetical protein
MILLMMEEIKAVAVLTPGVPSVSKIVSVSSVITLQLFHYFSLKYRKRYTREGQVPVLLT